MKIAIISEAIDTHSGSRAPVELAKVLSKKHHVTIIGKKHISTTKTLNILKKHKIETKLIGTNNSLKIIFELLPYFNKSNYDIIWSNATLSLFLSAALSNKPVITTYHGSQWNVLTNKMQTSGFFPIAKILDPLTNFLIWFKTLIIIMFSKKVVSISRYTQIEAKKYYFKTSKPIYWGTKIANSENHKINNVTIISVSRITPYKGFHLLINVFKKLSPKLNAKLIICGSQPQKNYLRYLKSIATKDVEIIINPSDEKLGKLYKSADIYATCDKYLFFGMPVLEAASYNLPTICLNFAAANEVVKNMQTGFVAKNMNEFQTKLELLVKNKMLRESLGKNSKAFSKEFSWQKTAQEYEKVFKQVIKHKNEP